MSGTELLIADEPTGQLDAETGRQIMKLLCAVVRSEGVTALVAAHRAREAMRGPAPGARLAVDADAARRCPIGRMTGPLGALSGAQRAIDHDSGHGSVPDRAGLP